MKLLGRPKNRWGWVRIAGWAAFALALLWTLLAALLRGMGDVPWLRWSGYAAFSVADGLEMAVVPLLAVIAAGWMEDQDHHAAAEQHNHHKAEQAAAEQRRKVLRQVEELVLAELPGADHHAPVQGNLAHDPGGETNTPPGSEPDVLPGGAAGSHLHGKPHAEPHDGPGGKQGGVHVHLSAPARLRLREAVLAALAELDGKGRGEMLRFLFERGLLNGDHPALDLPGANLSELHLTKTHLSGVALDGADLSGARLDGAHLESSRLSGAKLVKAHLRHAHLKAAHLAGSDLTGARLEGADLEGANLSGARLEGALLMGANLKRCALNGIQARGAHLQKADLSGSLGLAPGEAAQTAPMAAPVALDEAILIDTVLPDGRVVTNARGKEYLQNKEIATLIDRL